MDELEDYLEYLELYALEDGHDVLWIESEVLQTKVILSTRDEEARCGR